MQSKKTGIPIMSKFEEAVGKLFDAMFLKKILQSTENGKRELSPEVEIIKDKLESNLRISKDERT